MRLRAKRLCSEQSTWAGDPANRDAIEKVQDEFDLGLEWRVKVDDDDDDDK
jgi:hypothetical protein